MTTNEEEKPVEGDVLAGNGNLDGASDAECNFDESGQFHSLQEPFSKIVTPGSWFKDILILLFGSLAGVSGAVLSILLFKWLFVEDGFSVLQVFLVVPWAGLCGLVVGGLIVSLGT